MRIPRACLVCGQEAVPGQSRCPLHTRPGGWAQRPSIGTSKGYYGHAWQELRKRVLSEAGHACECRDTRCGHGPTCGDHAGTADHVVPLARGGAPYDRSNVQALCWKCHARKTGRESAAAKKEAARRRSVTVRQENEP
jgi:5-methylcytosine-specific restriction protein A